MLFPRPLVALLMMMVALGGCAGSEPETEAEAPALAPPVPPGNYTFDGFARVVTPGDLVPLPFVKTFLSSEQDGVDIEVGFWRPDTDEPVPVLVDAGPYYGNDGSPMENGAGHLHRLLTNFLPHGYAVAAIAVRGTGDSGGCMDLMGPVEVADLDQAITWLATQDWSNGNVAMLGKSYDGSTPWQVASVGNPHLKTIVPMSGVPDLYDLMFRNGTSEIRGPAVLNGLYYSYGVLAPQMLPPETADEAVRAVRQGVEGTACPDHAQGLLSSITAGGGMGRDAWWAARNLKPGVEASYNGSVLMVQGLQDWNVDPGMSLPWADDLARSGLVVHQMLGQWGHHYPDVVGNTQSANHRWDWAQVLLHWFDHFLKGKDVDLGPAVQVLDSEHRWRADHSFPPHDANLVRYNLSADGGLTTDAAQGGSIQLVPQAMPPGLVPTEPPGATADFYLPPQEQELLVSGLPKVHVTVTPQGNAGGLAAWLYSVHPDGSEERLGWAMMNLRFHDGGDQPHDLTPGQPILAKMEIQPMDGAVLEGERLMLRIWQYRDDPPNDQVQGRLPSVPMPVTLELGGDQSTLVLPTIERGPASYFEPPRP